MTTNAKTYVRGGAICAVIAILCLLDTIFLNSWVGLILFAFFLWAAIVFGIFWLGNRK